MNLTKSQCQIYQMESFAGGSVSVICGSLLIKESFDVAQWSAAANKILEISDALRINIKSGVTPQQEIRPFVPCNFPVRYFGSQDELREYAEREAQNPIQPDGDLCRLIIVFLPGWNGILIKLHHIIGDAWSFALLARQIYAVLKGEPVQSFSFAEEVKADEEYLHSKRYLKDRDFFLAKCQKFTETTLFSEQTPTQFKSLRKNYCLSSEQTAQIQRFAADHDTTPYTLFMSALAILILRTRPETKQCCIGTPILNRTTFREKNTIGMFIKTLPIFMELEPERTFAETVQDVQSALFAHLRHQRFDYTELLSTLNAEKHISRRFFDVMLSYQNARVVPEALQNADDIRCEWYPPGTQLESLQIHIDDRENKGFFNIQIDYLTELWNEPQIDGLFSHICNILYNGIQLPDTPVGQLHLMDKRELQQILEVFSRNPNEENLSNCGTNQCVHQIFSQIAEQTPEKLAVIAPDKTLTYAGLNGQANFIAQKLVENGIKRRDIVAFALPRTSALIATMLGILKAGAAYLPIDPDYPEERINFILKDSGAKLYITAKALESWHFFDRRDDDPGCQQIADTCSPEDPCYCIYTSGSTGKPKGALLHHRGIVNLVTHLDIYKDLSECRRFGWTTTITFDVATQEILTTLLNGYTGVLLPERRQLLISDLLQQLTAQQVDVCYFTPTYLDTIANNDENTEKLLKQLRVIVLAGEKCFVNDRVLRINKKHHTIFENQYGPVELHVIATTAPLDVRHPNNIGKPVPGNRAYIVDHNMQPVPIGVNGELCIAGTGVGYGYLNLTELTAQKFIPNPFGEGKLYKTGDIACWMDNGDILYQNRNDFLYKIRGQRIETEEIEHALTNMDGIQKAAVIVKENHRNNPVLCAFYTGLSFSSDFLHTSLQKFLPSYMMPDLYIHLEDLPLTVSGKLDRKALSDIDISSCTEHIPYTPPQTALQAELCSIVAGLLQMEHIGIRDNLPELGCSSLKIIAFVSAAREKQIHFSVQDVYNCKTIERLSQRLENNDARPPAGTAAHLTAEENARIAPILKQNAGIFPLQSSEETSVGNILLTGATGYLGAHLLSQFLDTQNGDAFCIVRGKSKAHSEQRLSESLSAYFGEKYCHNTRIHVLCGDLSQPHFGLTGEDYQKLLRVTQTVIHAAANVRHFGLYEAFYAANVTPVLSLIVFCRENGAKLIHLSTLSVSGTFPVTTSAPPTFNESSLDIGQDLHNVYMHSKFEAEKHILLAVSNGLKANIMRLGNITNRFSDGVFQKNAEENAFYQRFRAFAELGCLPQSLAGHTVDFTPVDEAARAIMTLTSHFSTTPNVFHICNPRPMPIPKLMDFIRSAGCNIQIIEDTRFKQNCQQAVQKNPQILQSFFNDFSTDGSLSFPYLAPIDCRMTFNHLRQLGFTWPALDFQYFNQYILTFRHHEA